MAGLVFNYFIRQRAFQWWKRYNCASFPLFPLDWLAHVLIHRSLFYVDSCPLTASPTDLLSAGLDTGVAFATIIIFFALSYNSITFDWWGNTIETMDTKSTPWKTVAKGSYFGPGPGEF